MKLKHLLSFFGALLLTLLVYAVVILLVFSSTFTLAGETLTSKEHKDAFCFFTCLFMTTTTVFIAIRRFRADKGYSGLGISLPLVFAVYISVVTGKQYFNNLNYRQPFDQKVWMQSKHKPFRMTKTLLKGETLIGQSGETIIRQLGPDDLNGDSSLQAVKGPRALLQYYTDQHDWYLALVLENNKVVNAYMYQEGFGL